MDESNAISLATAFGKKREGFRATPYLDAGTLAIGYGNHYYDDGSAVTATDTITEPDAADLISNVMAGKWNAIKPCISVDLTDYQAAGLIDLAYNWGEGNVCKSVLLQLINAGASASDIDAQWKVTAVTSKGVYSHDLYNRRGDESALYDTLMTSIVDPVKNAVAQLTRGQVIGIVLAATALIGGTVYLIRQRRKRRKLKY